MKDKILYILLLLTVSPRITAQKDQAKELFSLFSMDQKLISHAVDSSICIIQQQYTLITKNGKEYGNNSNVFFGRKYVIGVITDSGICATADILFPWEGDNSFNEFSTNDSLKAHLSKTFYKRPHDKSFTEIEKTKYKKKYDSSFVIFKIPDSIPFIGNSISINDTTGWMVMVKSNGSLDSNESASLNLTVLKLSPIDSSGKRYLKKETEKDDFIGGVYYTYHASTGKIFFYSAGIAIKDNKGWYLKPFLTTPEDIKNEKNTLQQLNSLPIRD